MIARRRITDITGRIAGGLPAAFSATRTTAGRAASRFPRPALSAAVSAAAILLAAVLASAAYSAAVPAQAAAQAPATAPVPVLHWRSCYGGFQCATARVPLSYRDPRGATISIAVVRHLATDPARRAGTLFINAGGPAEQIETFVTGFGSLPAGFTARFNTITFDPRGFGYSTAVRCFPTMAAESKFLGDASFGGVPVFPVGARQDAAWVRTWARFDARCAQRNGSLLDHDTTADEARDMNLLREAVGAPALNYLGLSYGTGLGATYANLFPATTGHMILDGNLNPVAWTHPDGAPTFLAQGTDQASAASMRAFLDLCGKTKISACAFSAGTPAATRAKWATLLRRLCRHPVTIGTGQTYTYAEVVLTVPLITVSKWPAGARWLQQLWAASSAARASTAASAARAAARAQASPPATATATATAAPAAVYAGWEQALAVLCSDSPNPRDPAAYLAAGRRAYARSGAFGLEQPWKTEACADWPAAAAQDRYSGPWNRPTASTILVLGNTGDPIAAYQDSVAMSRDLARARLLTVDGYGHTEAGNPSTCATNYEIRYLLTGALPPPRTVCKENATPFPRPRPAEGR
jgi:pimeloyl-ACP methyl ester carboxylesterase